MVWYGGRYEVLSDEDKRKWYNQGGILLVKNMETV
jgi:curved DNA-binding protein CbpA